MLPLFRNSFGERSEYDLSQENPMGMGLTLVPKEFTEFRLVDSKKTKSSQHKRIRIQPERLIGITSGIILILFGQASLDLSLQSLDIFYWAPLIMVSLGNFWNLPCVPN